MRRFQSGAIPESGDVRLDEAMSHHLLRVTRIRVGEQVELFDGRGKVARATLLSDDEGVAVLSIDEPSRLAAPAHAAHLLIGIPKGPAMDLAIRMATEAGATHIHPVLLQRSVAKGDRHDRWARIARSAAQQCGRGDIPELLPLAKLEEAATRLPEDVGRYVAHPGGEAASSATGAFALLIGPEGGLTDDELRRSEALGFERLGLGPWIFRAETACAVGIAALTAESSP